MTELRASRRKFGAAFWNQFLRRIWERFTIKESVDQIGSWLRPQEHCAVRQRSADPLWKISVPDEEQRGSTLSYVRPHCHRYPIWWVSSGHGKKQCHWWCAACSDQYQYNWKAPNRVLSTQDSTGRREARVFRAHAAPQGVCDNLIRALKPLGKPPEKSNNPIKMEVQDFQERSQLTTVDGLRRSIMVDNDAAVSIGDLRRTRSRGTL